MRNPVRKIVKFSGIALGGILAVLLAYVALLTYPSILFAKEIEYGIFRVHSGSEYGEELLTALDDIEAVLRKSEIYDPTLRHDIFFGYGNGIFAALHDVRAAIVSQITGMGQALTYNISLPPYYSHIITFRIPDFEANALSHPGRRQSINLRQTLAHEVVHSLLVSRLGLQRAARTPMWKQEGYADYIGSSAELSDDSYDIRRSVERILGQDLSWLLDDQGDYIRMRYGCQRMSSLQNESGFVTSTCYYISRVLWEYLLDVKELSFDDVMEPEVTDVDTLVELFAAYDSGQLVGYD